MYDKTVEELRQEVLDEAAKLVAHGCKPCSNAEIDAWVEDRVKRQERYRFVESLTDEECKVYRETGQIPR